MGDSAVIDLIKELPPKFYHLSFDNLFSSVPMFEEVSTIYMSGTGTMRQNRAQKCPLTDIKTMKKTDRGTMDFRSDPDTGFVIVRGDDNSVMIV
ncbi:PiggyBac transposable element-derived protein 3 [Plakobranchus ocellatus]|uniref:PiggyBac transposable element-derived protein 3 n=1 Tax=Plakobranchus ocellatus TaxID=259542 RepID=A0AAV4BI26_9GAST|nr:PiggyBac transposable element-derived protein 3 [Plakobranchus ocellatus]